MKRPIVLFTLSTLVAAGSASAQDGKVMYEQLCGACHGNDGRGAQEGQFPPLADSAWVKGKPDRMIQVILHGLMGEITVPSEHAASPTYNLVMPPQGAALTDQQIARIATYVRSSWGNEESAVTTAMVAEQRAATANKEPFWQASEILELYPLVAAVGGEPENALKVDVPIRNLLSYVYDGGSWTSLPDFKALKPKAVEEEHKGLISVSQSGMRDNFGMVWEGEIVAPKSGTFTFRLDSDDGSAVYLNGRKVTEVKGNGPMGRTQEGKVQLEQGKHKIRIEYYENGGGEDIALAMKGPGLKGWFPLSESKAGGGGGSKQSIPIYPLTNEAVIYRNFIEGTTPRGIGVGYHGGVNLAFSADTMSVDLLWTGLFMDGGRHWTGRGQGFEPPAGQNVVKVNQGPSFAILASQTTAWPESFPDDFPARFHGYKFNSRQEPTFYFTIGDLKIEDKPQPILGRNQFGLQRAITINVEGAPPANVHFRAANGMAVKEMGPGTFELGGQAVLEIGKGAANRPYVRNGNELLIPLELKKGENILNLRYSWK